MKRLFLLLIFYFFLCSSSFGSIVFDGSDDYLNTNNVNLGNNALLYSASLWIKTSSTNYGCVYGSFNTGSSLAMQLCINGDENASQNTGYITVYVRGTNAQDDGLKVASNTGITDGSWHHIFISVDAANNDYEIYVDSVSEPITLFINQNPSGVGNFGYNFLVGARNLRGTVQYYLNATLTDVAFWSVEYGQNEAILLYQSKNKRLPLQFPGLVIYYPLDNQPDGTSGDGDSFLDMAGTSNATGVDGANNTGLTVLAETLLTYP